MSEKETDRVTDSIDMNLSKLWETAKNREVWPAAVHWGSQRVRHNLATEQRNWCFYLFIFIDRTTWHVGS